MAVVLSPQKNVVGAYGRGPQPVGGPEDCDDGSFHDGAEVHSAGVVGYQNLRFFKHGRQFEKVGLSGEVLTEGFLPFLALHFLGYLRADRTVPFSADQITVEAGLFVKLLTST